jgi:hypothetical protein
MTVSTLISRASFPGNDVTTAFNYSFKIIEDADLVVELVDDSDGSSVTQVLNTDYTVTGAGTDSGTVTMTTAPASGETLVVYRDISKTQETDYILGDSFPSASHELALDKLTLICQDLQSDLDRKMGYSSTYTGGASLELPDPEALFFVRWNATATALENVSGTTSAIAADVIFTPAGDIAATNVQAALEELDTEKLDTGDIGSTVQAYDADIPTVAASQVEMEAGTESALRSMSPLRVAQAISALAGIRFVLPSRGDNTTETLTSSELEQVTYSTISSNVTKTLPDSTTISDDGAIVGFQLFSVSSSALLTIACGGSDTLNLGFATKPTSITISDSGDFVLFQLDKTNAEWVMIEDRIRGPYFRATRINSGQSVGTNTLTKCQYNTEANDSHGYYDNATNFRFTPLFPGLYRFDTGTFLSGAGRQATTIYKNGSLYDYGSRTYTTNDAVQYGSWEIEMNGTTDYVEIFAITIDNAGTFASAATITSFFTGRRIKR